MGAMYAVRLFSDQARTCPHTRPVAMSKTQAPESPGTTEGPISMVLFIEPVGCEAVPGLVGNDETYGYNSSALWREGSWQLQGLTSKVPIDAEASREGLPAAHLNQRHGLRDLSALQAAGPTAAVDFQPA